ncbi:hypothetical protein SISNIDRAFT_490007 [Sistotremastrum niveocremeum HHB9708]|uniref:C4-dicarboxylate transporter/malic acid transport protein n=1 Tax=Sistotremastrum niveocremeum HHB9708 TaxID=1314777 RepID=A0A164PC92_9AGAM|nr:hypothetical protein SISNIDRAFT_490007 [Sistotremastrum niveocremeum HHB9708]
MDSERPQASLASTPSVHYDGVPNSQSPALPWRERIRRFTPAWFYVVMGIAITAVNFGAIPFGHQHEVLKVLFLVYWFITVLILFLFTGLTVARYVMFPGLWTKMLNHPTESLYLACIPMALIPTENGINDDIIQWLGFLGKRGFKLLFFEWSMWLTTSIIGYVLAFYLLHKMITQQTHTLKHMTGAWILPFVALIVCASAGAKATPEIQKYNMHMALFTLLWSIFSLVIGLSMTFFIMAIVLLRLVTEGFPPPKYVMSSFLPMSAMTQAGFTILVLFNDAAGLFPITYGISPILKNAAISEIFRAFGLITGLSLWILALFWFVQAIFAVVHVARKTPGGLRFGADSWAWVFPFGVVGVHTHALALDMDSHFFHILTLIFNIAIIIGTSVMIVITVPKFLKGTIFYSSVIDEELAGETTAHHDSSSDVVAADKYQA